MKVRRIISGRKLKVRGKKSSGAEMPEPSKTTFSRGTGTPKWALRPKRRSAPAGKYGKRQPKDVKPKTVPAYAKPEKAPERINRPQTTTGKKKRVGNPRNPKTQDTKPETSRQGWQLTGTPQA